MRKLLLLLPIFCFFGQSIETQAASPTVLAETTSIMDTSAVTTHVVQLPTSGSLASGDTMLCAVGTDSGTSDMVLTWPAGWTVIAEEGDDGTPTTWLEIGWAESDGTESGSTFNITSSTSEQSAHNCYFIQGGGDLGVGAEQPEAEIIGANTDAPDPPSISPTGGSKDYLVFAFASVNNRRNITGWPATYTNTGQERPTSSGGVTLGYGRLEVTAASEDPGTFAFTTATNTVAATVAIHPAAAANDDAGWRQRHSE